MASIALRPNKKKKLHRWLQLLLGPTKKKLHIWLQLSYKSTFLDTCDNNNNNPWDKKINTNPSQEIMYQS
jgi:hypothetical protein